MVWGMLGSERLCYAGEGDVGVGGSVSWYEAGTGGREQGVVVMPDILARFVVRA